MSQAAPAIVWFDRDFRLHDHNPLRAAAASGRPLLCVYIHDTQTPGDARGGAASDWWLHHSLARLDASLRQRHGGLTLLCGRIEDELATLAHDTGAAALYWHRRHEPWAVALEQRLRDRLRTRLGDAFELRRFPGRLLFEPETIRTGSGAPYRVFTPFWRSLQRAEPPHAPLDVPSGLTLIDPPAGSCTLEDLGLLPELDWADGFASHWTPGEDGARVRLEAFTSDALAGYGDWRDRPDVDGTSRLSPHLAFGEVSPRTVWHCCIGALGDDAEPFLRELGWREFSWHLLASQPDLQVIPLRPEFSQFPWAPDHDSLERWRHGRTGYPFVDAGMRQLWQTGWLHNRARMVTGSFLVKQLLQPWQQGEAWFRDTLVDWDLASNAASWQWVAGTGTDAAPYFRVFNPVLQGRKFDPDGAYVRRWIPELQGLPDKRLHSPWESADTTGIDYPDPVIDPGEGRDRALEAYAAMRAAISADD